VGEEEGGRGRRRRRKKKRSSVKGRTTHKTRQLNTITRQNSTQKKGEGAF
jgi:hypothetical protein